MDKKKIIMIAVVVILLIFLGFLWFFSNQDSASEGGGSLGGFPSGALFGDDRLNNITEQQRVEELKEKGFVQLTARSVSGAEALSSTTIRYIAKETGHIFDINIEEMNNERVSNTTIPKIFEAIWSSQANKFVAKYVEDIEQGQRLISVMRIFLASVAGDETSQVLEGVFLPKGIDEVAISPDGERVFYILESEGMYYGFVANFNNDDRRVIYMSSYGDFNISWPNQNRIVLLTKPSGNVKGFVYFLNPNTERVEKIIGGVEGVTVLVSPDAENMIYGFNSGKLVEIRSFNIEDSSIADVPTRTLPEKCVWSKKEEGILYCGVPTFMPRAKYPDDWYKGLVSFNDSIWRVNLLSGEAKKILDNSNTDAINLFLTPDEKHLVFMNKTDGTLWRLELAK